MSTRYEIRFKDGEREKFESFAAREHLDLASWIRMVLHREVDFQSGLTQRFDDFKSQVNEIKPDEHS